MYRRHHRSDSPQTGKNAAGGVPRLLGIREGPVRKGLHLSCSLFRWRGLVLGYLAGTHSNLWTTHCLRVCLGAISCCDMRKGYVRDVVSRCGGRIGSVEGFTIGFVSVLQWKLHNYLCMYIWWCQLNTPFKYCTFARSVDHWYVNIDAPNIFIVEHWKYQELSILWSGVDWQGTFAGALYGDVTCNNWMQQPCAYVMIVVAMQCLLNWLPYQYK